MKNIRQKFEEIEALRPFILDRAMKWSYIEGFLDGFNYSLESFDYSAGELEVTLAEKCYHEPDRRQVYVPLKFLEKSDEFAEYLFNRVKNKRDLFQKMCEEFDNKQKMEAEKAEFKRLKQKYG